MGKNIDEHERLVLLHRFHNRQDAILLASREIEDLRVEYIAGGRKDPDGRIEAEVVKRLLTIFSCLNELGASQFLRRHLADLPYIQIRLLKNRGTIKADEEAGSLHIVEMSSTAVICALANLIEVRWQPKKGPYVNVDLHHLESILQIILRPL